MSNDYLERLIIFIVSETVVCLEFFTRLNKNIYLTLLDLYISRNISLAFFYLDICIQYDLVKSFPYLDLSTVFYPGALSTFKRT